MVDELLERNNYRDYILKFIWGCRQCALPVWIFLNRTADELVNNLSNLHQKCYDGHISIPLRQCTRCNQIYPIEKDLCDDCEKRVKEITLICMEIDDLEKEAEKDKLNKKFLEAKILKRLSDLDILGYTRIKEE